MTNPGRTRITQAVNYIYFFTMAALLVPIIRSWLAGWPLVAGILSAAAAVATVAFILNRRGSPQKAAAVLVHSALVGAMTLMWITKEGLHDEALFLVPTALIFAALLLSWRQYCAVSVLAILAVSIVGLAEMRGLTASHRPPDNNFDWLLNVDLILLVTAMAAGLMAWYLRAYADEARLRAAELRESESRYRELVDNAPIGIYRTTVDGRLELVNATLLKMLGFDSIEDLANRDLERGDYEPSYDRAWFKQIIEERGEIRGHEDRWTRRDGTHIDVRESAKGVRGPDGGIRCYDGVVEDISERKRAEDALRREQAFIERVIDAIPGIFFVLDEQLHYVRWNKVHEVLFGLPQGQIRETDALTRIHPDDRARVAAAIARIFSTGAAEVEARGLVGEGPETRHFFMTGRSIQIDGAPYIIGFGIDTTARHELEAARAQLEEQLLQAQRLESLGRLAGGVAHDFNNLLTVINGYSDLLLMRLGPESEAMRRHLTVIRQTGERATALTQQLLAFGRRQVTRLEPVDIDAVAAEVVELNRRVIGASIEFDAELGAGSHPILADSSQVHQVLMNLVINARDAMPAGGRLLIQTRAVAVSPERAAQLDLPAGDYVRITVADTGCGMDEHVRTHLFEPFFTTKPVGKGTGLGLSTVYGIVRSCNGAIRVESLPGSGSTFEIHLPCFSGVRPEVESRPDSGGVRLAASTVLVVEDEPAVRQFAVEVLTGCGYQVLHAASAEEALRIGTRYALPINLLLTDMVMPGINGRELARQMMAIHPESRVLLVSGHSEILAGEGGMLEAGSHYLQKPYSPRQLTATVERILSAEG